MDPGRERRVRMKKESQARCKAILMQSPAARISRSTAYVDSTKREEGTERHKRGETPACARLGVTGEGAGLVPDLGKAQGVQIQSETPRAGQELPGCPLRGSPWS